MRKIRRLLLWATSVRAAADADIHQHSLNSLAMLLNHEADSLNAMASTLRDQDKLGSYNDAVAVNEEAAAMQAVGSGTSLLQTAGQALGSRASEISITASLRGAHPDIDMSDFDAMQLNQLEVQKIPRMDLLQRHGAGGDWTQEEKRLQSLLEMRRGML
mmetsp:Transcript_11545/g.21860  ORF Transcript_11545/g.21860 Transcript_11545/m.21860 type:complete len:159 (-) Transcript_11545:166-642(-)